MKLREAIADALQQEGVETVFGVMGDGNMLLWSDLVDRAGLRVLNARTETGAMLMADGYQRAGGGIGVVTVTHGPGLASTAVGMGVAVAANSPILVIAGDVPRDRPNHVQAFPQEVFGSAVGATVFSVRTATEGLPSLQRAIQHVGLGRGPALLSVAVDVQEEDVPVPYVPSATISAAPGLLHADDRALYSLAAHLRDAERPIILAGRGACAARDNLEVLAEASGALLATTVPARGLFAEHARDAGVLGGLSEPDMRPYFAKADLVVAFGASLNRFTLDFGQIVPTAQIALVTDSPPAGPFPMPVDPVVLGDARDAAERLCDKLVARPNSGDGWDLAAIAVARRDGLANLPEHHGDLLDPRTVVQAVDAHFPADRTEVVGVGHFGGWPGMYSRLGRGGRFMGPWEFGAIGVGVPVALGAAVARPHRPTVAWEGDGSLLWALGELDTLARANARVTVIAMDDGAYGAEVWKLEKLGANAANAQFPRRDLAAAANALGVPGYSVQDIASLNAALAAAAASSGPSLIHVPIDPAHRQEVF